MGLLDKVKATAARATEAAKDAAAKGQAKLDEAQAKKAADGMLRDLGAAYLRHEDRPDNAGHRCRDRTPGGRARRPRVPARPDHAGPRVLGGRAARRSRPTARRPPRPRRPRRRPIPVTAAPAAGRADPLGASGPPRSGPRSAHCGAGPVRCRERPPSRVGCFFAAGWSSLVARRAHNPKVGGSNPPPATQKSQIEPVHWAGSSAARRRIRFVGQSHGRAYN